MFGFKNPIKGDFNFKSAPLYLRYGLPLLLLSWITLIKLSFEPIGHESPFLMYFGVILITAKYFGERVSVLITICACLVAEYFFIPPYNSFNINFEHLIQCLVFIGESFLIIGVIRTLQKTTVKMNKSDMLFKTIVEKSTEGFVMYSAEAKRLYSSPSVQQIFGYSQEEYLEIPSWQLVHPDDVADVKEQFYRCTAHAGKTITILHRYKHKNGNWRWIESRVTNLLDEPLINAMVSNLRDVTDRVLLEKQREEFIGVASHELKTPLTSLKAFTQVLKSRFKHSEDQNTYTIVNKIDLQVSRVIQMVTDLLDTTILQAGKLVVYKAGFNFNELVAEVIQTMEHQLTNHVVVTKLLQTPEVWGDRERIDQVLSNLLSNAVKYSPSASIIEISSEIESDHIIIRVKDQGIGITATELENIFGKFYRAEHLGTGTQGLGLGLFICHEIITMHKGKIGAESQLGQGSVFWFTLPLKKTTEKQKAPPVI